MRLDPNCRAVCFDMDGTLLDTKVDYQGISDAVFRSLEASDYPKDMIDRSRPYKENVDRWFAWMHGQALTAHHRFKRRSYAVEVLLEYITLRAHIQCLDNIFII